MRMPGRVWIACTRYFYGPRRVTRPLRTETGEVWTGTHSEARAMIRSLDREVYSLGSGECGRPVYRIRYDRTASVARWIEKEERSEE